MFYVIFLILLVAAVAVGSRVGRKSKWINTAEFEKRKKALKLHCSEQEFTEFFDFLQQYEGGYIRRRNGQIVQREYLNREKGDLKGIFFNIIMPNPNLHSYQKEEFRKFLRSIGVTGVDARPDYETRDTSLRNRETDFDSFHRKEVGNAGEELIRKTLKELEQTGYHTINGAKLKFGNTVKEYDHIVVSLHGVFVIETKAFGMTNGEAVKCGVFIDPDDHWILRKKQTNKDLHSPTEQITAAVQHLSLILQNIMFSVHGIVVLSNENVFIKQNIELPYQVVRIDALTEALRSVNDHLTESDIRIVLHAIDESRVN